MKNLSRFWKQTIGAAALSAVIAMAPRGLAETKAAKVRPYPLKTCLVSGEKFAGDMGQPYAFTYNGQEFKLCCPACKKDFDKDPAKYAKKLAEAERQMKPAAVMSGHAGNHGGQAPEKGAERLVHLQSVKTLGDLETIQPGDVLVMSCPKCKDMTATVVEQTFKAAHPEETKNLTMHLCPGCDSKIVTVGHGKTKTDKLMHTCKKCGSQDVLCCVMKKGDQPMSSADGMK